MGVLGVFFDFSFIYTRVRARVGYGSRPPRPPRPVKPADFLGSSYGGLQIRDPHKTPKTPIHGRILGRCEAPTLRIVQQFSLPKMHKPIAGPEGTVAELGKGSPEGDLQAMVVLRADGQAGLRIPREANQITDARRAT